MQKLWLTGGTCSILLPLRQGLAGGLHILFCLFSHLCLNLLLLLSYQLLLTENVHTHLVLLSWHMPRPPASSPYERNKVTIVNKVCYVAVELGVENKGPGN